MDTTRIKAPAGWVIARLLAGAAMLALAWPGWAVDVQESGEPPAATPQARAPSAPSTGAKAFDAVAVRPVSFFTSVFSAGVFVVSLPFTAFDPAIGVGKARENLVDYPFGDTFKRPLGDLEDTTRLPADPFAH